MNILQFISQGNQLRVLAHLYFLFR